jgi:hypothetical protein
LSVTFDFGDTTRVLHDDLPALIAERLLVRTTEAKSEVAYQVAINIKARIEGVIESPVPMKVKEERDELWEVVNPLREERPGDKWLDLLWQALFSARLQDHDPPELIRAELRRVGADEEAVGTQDAIRINDSGEGYGQLKGHPRGHDFYWNGTCEDILLRLARLPAGSGPEAVRSEFHT